MLNGAKAIKEMLAHSEKNQVELAAMLGITKAALSQRMKQGYFNTPERLSEACSALGYTMNLKIECRLFNDSDSTEIVVSVHDRTDEKK